MTFPITISIIEIPITVRVGHPSTFHNDRKLISVFQGNIFLPIFIIATHTKSVVTQDVSVIEGYVQQRLRIRRHCFLPRILISIAQHTVIVDHQRHFREMTCIQRCNPLHYLKLISIVSINHSVRLSPFTQSVTVNKIYLIGVIVLAGKSLDKLSIVLLEHLVIRIRTLIVCCIIPFTAFIEYELRSILFLVAPIHQYTQGDT